MNKRILILALVALMGLGSCTSKQTEKISRSEPWQIPLRLLGL